MTLYQEDLLCSLSEAILRQWTCGFQKSCSKDRDNDDGNIYLVLLQPRLLCALNT